MATRKLSTKTIFFGFSGIAAIFILGLLTWNVLDTPKQVTLAEADAALYAFERNRDLAETRGVTSPEKCSDKYTFYFRDATRYMASLKKAASLEDAQAQMKLLYRFGYDRHDQSKNICKIGHQLAENAMGRVAYNINTIYSDGGTSTEDELLLLSHIPSTDSRLKSAVKKRLAAKGCSPVEVDYPYPSYICA